MFYNIQGIIFSMDSSKTSFDTSVYSTPFSVLFMRHAFSKWNKYCGKSQKKKKDIVIEQKYIDPRITKNKGVEGVLEAAKDIKERITKEGNLPIRAVFVSPLVRALQTCDLAFKDLPSSILSEIEFFIHPGLTSRINHITDLSFNYKEYMLGEAKIKFDDRYMREVYKKMDIQDLAEHPQDPLDNSHRDWQIKYLKHLCDPQETPILEALDKMQGVFDKHRGEGQPGHEQDIPKINEKIFEESSHVISLLEPKSNLNRRVYKFSKFLRVFAHERGLKDNQILVISHNGVLNAMFYQKNENAKLSEGKLWTVTEDEWPTQKPKATNDNIDKREPNPAASSEPNQKL